MGKTCPNCGEDNPLDAIFCHSCGKPLEGRIRPDTAIQVSTEEKVIPDVKPERRPRKRLRYLIGCLVILLIIMIVVPTMHLTILRPRLQSEIFERVDQLVNENLLPFQYQGSFAHEIFLETDINQFLDELSPELPFIQRKHVELHQDAAILTLTAMNLDFRVSADIRVNNKGEIVVRAVQMDLPFHFIFTAEGIRNAIEHNVNETLIRPSNLFLHALQVSEGRIFVVYKARAE